MGRMNRTTRATQSTKASLECTSTGTSDLADARSFALRLLSYRGRSEAELARRLREKGYTQDLAVTLIIELTRDGYLNDKRFATELAASRVRNKHWGTIKIASELRAKGIDRETINGVVAGFRGLSEQKAAELALEKWLNKTIGYRHTSPSPPLEAELEARCRRHLKSRGFPPSVINSTIVNYRVKYKVNYREDHPEKINRGDRSVQENSATDLNSEDEIV